MRCVPRTEPGRAAARPPRRKLDGVLLLDKPAGLSSNQCLGVVKRLFAAQKAGHTGTLDPFATGLLPVALGEATKFSQGMLEADKTYLATMRLGVTTSTGDTEGEVVREAAVAVDAAQVAAAMAAFVGEIMQVPPMYSALKRDGRPLYEYARAGIEIERDARRVVIHALDLLSVTGPVVVFRACCSKGTYIRTLAEDIGNALGCGAHLTALRREAVAELRLAAAHGVPALEAMAPTERDAVLLPVDALVAGLPIMRMVADEVRRLRLGQRIALAQIEAGIASDPEPGPVRVYAEGGAFIGLVTIRDGALRPQRLVSGA
jgi:tRNA pseudouridine55 synthase